MEFYFGNIVTDDKRWKSRFDVTNNVSIIKIMQWVGSKYTM